MGPLGFTVLALLMIPGLWQAGELTVAFEVIGDIAYGAVLMWCFFHISEEREDAAVTLVRALILMAPLAAVQVLITYEGSPDFGQFCGWKPEGRFTYGAHYTAWSMSLALVLPLASLGPTFLKGRRTAGIAIGVAIACALFSSQLVSGGRTGLMCSLLCIPAFMAMRSARWFALALAAIALAAAMLALFDSSCGRHLRLERLFVHFAANEEARPALSSLGTGRIEGYRTAIDRISEKPILGHGWGGLEVEGVHRPSVEIHNLWLKWAAYTGLLAPLYFALLVIAICRKGLQLLKDLEGCSVRRKTILALLLIVACGIVATLLQPNALIGSFQYTAIWWAAAGILLGTHAQMRGEKGYLTELEKSVRHRGGALLRALLRGAGPA